MEYYIGVYVPSEGKAPPFLAWLETLTRSEQVSVRLKLEMLAKVGPHYKNVKSLKDGLWELKVGKKGHSPLRVYLSFEAGVAIVLYGGSGKDDQSRAIAVARNRLNHFRSKGALGGLMLVWKG